MYSGLSVVAVDFPSHRTLPINEKISFFENGNKNNFIEALKNINLTTQPSTDELKEISIETRAEKIIEFVF